jgi:integrase
MTFLTTQFGKPFTSNGFGNWFRDQCNAAGLPRCSAHGLRKAAARWLAEAGCTAHEIASITGHASLKQELGKKCCNIKARKSWWCPGAG